jgi:uroporphyrinogen-III synthase
LRVLVTRPEDQAAETVRLLRERGDEPLLDPLLRIERLPPPAEVPAGTAALAVTSANAVAALAALPTDLPVFAVGRATARALHEAGRAPLAVAGGDGVDLARILAGALPAGAIVLHVAGQDVRPGLAEELAAAGLVYRRVTVYAAVAAERLAPTTEAALRAGALDAVLLFSPRTAALFAGLVRDAGLARGLAGTVAACLSEAVAAEVAGLPFVAVRVADARDQKALLRRLDG